METPLTEIMNPRLYLRARGEPTTPTAVSAVPMAVRHAQPTGGLSFEIELDHHNRFFADDPPVVTRLDRDDLRSTMLDDASVRIFDVNLAVDEEADVRVHAQLGANHGLHIH